VSSKHEEMAAVVNKTEVPETEKSQLLKQDIRLLLVLCAGTCESMRKDYG